MPYAVCSQSDQKPSIRYISATLDEAESHLAQLRQAEARSPESDYWIAEVGAEGEAWHGCARVVQDV